VCTVVILQRAHPAHPVIVAANRDEFYRRDARGPAILLDHPRVVGGLDVTAGGSWFGVTATGFLAAMTNEPEPSGPRTDTRSRGEVVVEALRRASKQAVREYLATLDARHYNSFNLLFGDASGLEVAYGRTARSRVEIVPVPDGVSVLPNGRIDECDGRLAQAGDRVAAAAKVTRTRTRAREAARATTWADLVAGLANVLADHERPSLDEMPPLREGFARSRELVREVHALCIHSADYGTRSAAVAALEPARVAAFAWADGPPCRATFDDALQLLT